MDYKAVVFDGYINSSSRNNLRDYYLRQFKNAQKKNYTKGEFFDGCLEIVRIVDGFFVKEVLAQKKELLQVLVYKNKVNDIDEVKRIKDEIKEVKKEDFTVNLTSPYFDNKYVGTLYYSHLQFIKSKLIEAKLHLGSNEVKSLLKEINESKEAFEKKLLKDYIWENRHSEFLDINKKFVDYWKSKKKTKKELIGYLRFLVDKGFFKNHVDGRKLSDRHGKDFLSLYYYRDKMVLSEAKKQYYNKIKNSTFLNTILSS